MENHRVIQVKCLPATNIQPTRIKLTENRFNKSDSKIIYFANFDNSKDNAIEYLQKIGLNVVGFGSFSDAYYIFSNTWATDKGFINIKGTIEKN